MFLPNEHDPFTPVDRRWRRCQYLVSRRRPTWHPSDDPWVRAGVQFLRSLPRCRTERQQRRLAEKIPVVHQAHAIHKANVPLRWAIEARLLAAEDFDSIARKCNTTPEVIEGYEALFFNVLDKLDAIDYIVCQVIGRKLHYGLRGDDTDIIWKLYGYRGGPILLNTVIDGAIGCDKPETPDEIDSFLEKEARTTLLLKLSIAGHVLMVTPENALAVMAVLSPLVHAQSQPGQTPAATGAVPFDAQALLDALQILNQGNGTPVNRDGDPTPGGDERQPDHKLTREEEQEKRVGRDWGVPEPIRRRVGLMSRAGEPVLG